MSNHTESPREESGAHRLAALLRNDTTAPVDEERDQAGWQRLLSAAHQEDARAVRKPRFLWVLAPATLCAALLALGLYRAYWAPSPLHFTLDGHKPSGDYLASEPGRPRQVDFSDGSSLVLRSSGRLRVTDADSDGATLLLECGQLDVSIRHRPSSRWRVDVGPYAVQVTGTRFTVTWDSDRGDLGVSVLDGTVAIRGPGIFAPITVQGGQQFRASQLGSYTVQSQPKAASLAPAEEPPPAEAPAEASSGRHVASAAKLERSPSPSAQKQPACAWAGLVSRGQFEATVSQARLLGLETALAECPPRGLFALADAARYLGQFDLGQSALLAIRKRSPDDTGKAAFFLGRLEEARGNLESALDYYAQAMEGSFRFAQEAKAGRTRVAKRMRALDARAAPATP